MLRLGKKHQEEMHERYLSPLLLRVEPEEGYSLRSEHQFLEKQGTRVVENDLVALRGLRRRGEEVLYQRIKQRAVLWHDGRLRQLWQRCDLAVSLHMLLRGGKSTYESDGGSTGSGLSGWACGVPLHRVW